MTACSGNRTAIPTRAQITTIGKIQNPHLQTMKVPRPVATTHIIADQEGPSIPSALHPMYVTN
jgi:hypothetical protein